MGLKRANRTLNQVLANLEKCMDRIKAAADDPGLSEKNKNSLLEFKRYLENATFNTPVLEETEDA